MATGPDTRESPTIPSRHKPGTVTVAGKPDLPGCVAVGESRDEVLRLIREAIEFHIEGLRHEGLPVPEPISEGAMVEVGAA
jgi:predicted RNase H-like HicB family nuclease